MTDTQRDLYNYQRAQAKARAERKKEVKKMKGIKPKPKKGSRVGKLGIVRLVGKELTRLRLECFERDGYRCQECGRLVSWNGEERMYFDYLATFPRGEMAHIRTKRNNGDTLDNVRTLCPDCHRLEHNGGKPVPSKKNCGISQ